MKGIIMNAYEIVREFFPNAHDEECEYIIWEKTGYPQFWNIPKDGATPIECFRTQIKQFKDSLTEPETSQPPNPSLGR
jgi:hypothetical protein